MTDLVDNYKIAHSDHPSNLSTDLHIDRMNLSEEFEKHSERYSWYATAYELALDHEARLKTELDRMYAVLDVQKRSEMANANVKVTEKKVENMVIIDVNYTAVYDAYQDAKLQTGLLKAARDAMQSKKDCLISLGANVRAEMASDPSLLQEAYRNRNK